MVSEEREASLDNAAHPEGMKALFLQHGTLVWNTKFQWDASFWKSQVQCR